MNKILTILALVNISKMTLPSTVNRSSLEPLMAACTEKCQRVHSNPSNNNREDECDSERLC